MPKLTPYPLAALVTRMFRELEEEGAVFGLPARRFYCGDMEKDFTVSFHGSPAGSPLGPAAGPHTQMAQNIVLSWLAGSRILELKTVQILDELELPRPCIDMRTVGLNAEWSQELRLEQSLDEYVKGVMLVEMLRATANLPLAPRFEPVRYDMSLGYDLAGLRSDRVRAFVGGMLDAGPAVDRLRREIPETHRTLRDLPYPSRISESVTLSTFHGCPPDEIAKMCAFLMREVGVDCTIKFNPVLLGRRETERLLYDTLGYRDVLIPEGAFIRDTTWRQAVDIVEQLESVAEETGRHLAVKFTNTLVVKNQGDFIPEAAQEVYLSGPPLHVLAIQLVERFRRHFGDTHPISFSAGIDRDNFPDAVALGLVPVTVCTDLLKRRGYGRLPGYYQELARRMKAVQAETIADFILHAYGQAERALERAALTPAHPRWVPCRQALAAGGDLRRAAGENLYERWVSEAKQLNTGHYARAVLEDPRYGRSRNDRPPKTIDSRLDFFDCISCDLCLPVCPNAANFTYRLDEEKIPIVKLLHSPEGWTWREEGALRLGAEHQIANFADFCNDCGNCDVFCPEDGAPYLIKPRFFGSEQSWRSQSQLDGFCIKRRPDRDVVLARMEGVEYRLEVANRRASFAGPFGDLSYSIEDPAGSLTVRASDEVDLTPALIMDCLRRALLDTPRANFVNSLYLVERDAS